MIRHVPREQAGEATELWASAPAAPESAAEPRGEADAQASVRSVACALVRLLGEELRLKPEHIREVVTRELSRVRRAAQIELRVHPEDAVLLETGADYARALELSAQPTLIMDRTLERGGCVLDTNLGEVDARLETRLLLALNLLASGAFR